MDYAIKTIKMRADSGDVDAMLELGRMYANGDGVKCNPSKAEKYLLKAAGSGDVRAQIELGKLYNSAKYNPAKSKLWWEKAAAQGNDEAAYLIGSLYYNGAFDSYDYETAVQWLLKPAERENPDAQLLLGLCYFELENNKECFYWLKKAAEKDNGEAQYWYALYADISDKEMELWLNKALKNGYSQAYNDLGRLYIYSEECKNYGKGIELLTVAAEQGDPAAMCSLAECYYDGEAIARDTDKAFYWYSRAGKYYVFNYTGLGKCYLYGEGVKKDLKKAVKYFKKSMCKEAVYELGNCYFNGWGVVQDKDKAKSLWIQSAEQGFEKAQKALDENFK